MLTTSYFFNIESKSYDLPGGIFGFILIIIMVFSACFSFLYNAYGRVNFYNDFIRIAEVELLNQESELK